MRIEQGRPVRWAALFGWLAIAMIATYCVTFTLFVVLTAVPSRQAGLTRYPPTWAGPAATSPPASPPSTPPPPVAR